MSYNKSISSLYSCRIDFRMARELYSWKCLTQMVHTVEEYMVSVMHFAVSYMHFDQSNKRS